MKKNLAVRIGAIVMVLMVAFFSILPDLVSAEGDDTDLLAESEIVAEAPDAEVPEITEDDGAEDAAPSEEPGEGEDLGEEPAEPELPDPDAPAVEEPPVTDPSEDENTGDASDSEEEPAEPEIPGEETPSPEEPGEGEAPADTQEPDQTQTDSGDAGETNADGMDTIDDYLAMIDWSKFQRVTGAAKQFADPSMKGDAELFASEEEDFLIEGTTLVKYLGSAPYVEIPAQITVIGDSAFAGNTSLLGVILPANLQSIGNSAFNGCSNLAEISIPDSVTSVGDSAFANCTGLTGLSIGAGTGTVSSNEFYNCISLQSVAVPEGISSVRAGAFANCSNLSSISLPSTLASLDRGAFSGDTNLASISIAAGSAYTSYDGCVYTGDGRQLLFCPQGKTGISIAPGTASIASGAFTGCNYLLSAVVPDAANAIESNAFSGSAIKSVTIPTGVTSIGSQSGWTPNVVYGYTGSTAEAWARQNNYVFESLNASSTGGTESIQDEHIEDPDDEENNTETETRKGSGGTKITSATGSSGSGTTAAISRNAGSRTNATPKTGVEDYGIYFLFAAIFLTGIAFFAYSRKLRLDR